MALCRKTIIIHTNSDTLHLSRRRVAGRVRVSPQPSNTSASTQCHAYRVPWHPVRRAATGGRWAGGQLNEGACTHTNTCVHAHERRTTAGGRGSRGGGVKQAHERRRGERHEEGVHAHERRRENRRERARHLADSRGAVPHCMQREHTLSFGQGALATFSMTLS